MNINVLDCTLRDGGYYNCYRDRYLETSENNLYGGAGNDLLCGSKGEDTLDGGTGTDILNGATGADTFITRAGDGSNDLDQADTILDFEDGTDLIGLDNGLTFDDLTITQGTGDNANHTIVRLGNEYLLIIQNVSAENLTSPDFTPVTIDESLH